MNSDTGDMKPMKDFASELDALSQGYNPLPHTGTVVQLFGNWFVIESYDTNENKMILKGVSKREAQEQVLRNSNR